MIGIAGAFRMRKAASPLGFSTTTYTLRPFACKPGFLIASSAPTVLTLYFKRSFFFWNFCCHCRTDLPDTHSTMNEIYKLCRAILRYLRKSLISLSQITFAVYPLPFLLLFRRLRRPGVPIGWVLRYPPHLDCNKHVFPIELHEL